LILLSLGFFTPMISDHECRLFLENKKDGRIPGRENGSKEELCFGGA